MINFRNSTAILPALALLMGLSQESEAQTVKAPKTGNLEEITVTARKREERLQTVPVAISAVTQVAQERYKIDSLNDLHLAFPNITVVHNTGTTNAAQVYMRGIGQDDSTFTAEQGIGLYLDGVYLGKQNGAMLDLIEFERIEILRGPQGTLYGRNSTAGAIKFVTKRPDLDNETFVADATIGSYNRFDQRASFSTPIVPGTWAVKVDAINRRQDGWMTDLAHGENINNTDRQEGRLSSLWQPSDKLSVYVTTDYTHDGSNINVPTAITRQADGSYAPTYGPRITTRSVDNLQKYDGGGASAEVSYDVNFATIKSISAYRAFWNPLRIDLDAGPTTAQDIYQRLRQNQISEELQISSPGSDALPLKYTAGVYYFHEVVGMYAENIFQSTNNRNMQTTDSYAIFGEGSYKVLNGVSISAGARYSKDEKSMDTTAWSRTNNALLFDLKGINPKFSAFTPKAGIDWQITDDILAYGSWSKGYKSGGFISGRPVSVSQATGVFQPEKVTAYEAGVKADIFDKRLRVNMAYFSNDYNNLQLSYLQNGQYNVATADAKISGFELEATTRPIEGLTLSATLGTLDAKYVKIPINPATGLSYVAGLTLANKLKHSPASEYRLAATYEIPLANRGAIELNTNYTWADTIYHSVSNNASITSPPYGVLDAQVAYITPNEKWRIALGGKNITDELYWVQGVATFSRFYADPAEFYLNVRYRY